MNKCTRCGHVFSDDEREIETETHGLDSGPYESYSTCPMCGGEYETAAQCDLCGDYFLEEEMHNGVCDKCLIDSITYDSFLGFMKSTEGELERFCFKNIYGIEPPEETNIHLRNDLVQKYQDAKKMDTLCKGLSFICKINKYILEDKDTTELFAEYLKEVKE